jgi:hypothetical protein
LVWRRIQPRCSPPGPARGRQGGQIEDLAGFGVGDEAFQAVSDLDAHGAVVAGIEQQQAVVLAGSADAETTEQFVGEILYDQAPEVADGDHGQFHRGLVLQLAAYAIDHADVLGPQHSAAVGDERSRYPPRVDDFLDLFRPQGQRIDSQDQQYK